MPLFLGMHKLGDRLKIKVGHLLHKTGIGSKLGHGKYVSPSRSACGASAIGAVWMQYKKLVAYESRKLNFVELNN